MPKSKEQKQKEALERNIEHYLACHVPTWSNRMPGGLWWMLPGNDLDNDIATALQETQNLLRYANELGITFEGTPGFSTGNNWTAQELLMWCLSGNNLQETRERMQFNVDQAGLKLGNPITVEDDDRVDMCISVVKTRLAQALQQRAQGHLGAMLDQQQDLNKEAQRDHEIRGSRTH